MGYLFVLHYLLYVVFDPHAKSSEGLIQHDGKSNIFFFSNVELLYKYLHGSGYGMNDPFTLTPFIISYRREIHTNLSNDHTDQNINSKTIAQATEDGKDSSAKKRKSNIDYDSQYEKRLKVENVKNIKENNKFNIQAEQKTQMRHKNPYKWPAPIDESFKKKCLINFVQKMSKNEIEQKICCICNRIGFQKDYKKVKFLDLNRELLEPTQDLINLVQGLEKRKKNKEKEMFKKTSPEVDICQEDGVSIPSKDENSAKNKLNDENIDKEVSNSAKKGARNYFYYKNIILSHFY